MNAHSTRRSTRTLVPMALCMALQVTGFVMILPLFARRFDSFGAGVQALGLSSMAYALTSTIAAPFIGALADRFGRRRIILISLGAYALAFGGYLLATSAWILILLRGLGNALFDPALNASILDITPAEYSASMIGLKSTAGSLGNMLGPALVVLVTPYLSPQAVFLIAAVLVAVLTLISGLVLGNPDKIKLSQNLAKVADEQLG